MKSLKQKLKTGSLSVRSKSDLEYKNFRLLFYAFLVGLTAGAVGRKISSRAHGRYQ